MHVRGKWHNVKHVLYFCINIIDQILIKRVRCPNVAIISHFYLQYTFLISRHRDIYAKKTHETINKIKTKTTAAITTTSTNYRNKLNPNKVSLRRTL